MKTMKAMKTMTPMKAMKARPDLIGPTGGTLLLKAVPKAPRAKPKAAPFNLEQVYDDDMWAEMELGVLQPKPKEKLRTFSVVQNAARKYRLNEGYYPTLAQGNNSQFQN